jgi:NADPH2:quinone reductase
MLKIADEYPEIIADCMKEILDLYRKNEIRTYVGGIFSVQQMSEAHALLESGKSMGKITVKWD